MKFILQFTDILVIYYRCNVLGLVAKDLQPMTQVIKGVGFSKTPSTQHKVKITLMNFNHVLYLHLM